LKITLTIASMILLSAGVLFAQVPNPTITGLNPASVPAGSGGFTLTVTGANYVATPAPGSRVRWNGSFIPTTVISATQLQATVSASLVVSTGIALIDVVNPTGQTSNQVQFVITAPLTNPTITSLFPTSIVAGSAGFTLTVTGTDYVSGAGVRWNGVAIPTTFVNATQLQATVSASLVANAGAALIDVVNPDGSVSNQSQFRIIAPLSITTSSPLPSGLAGSPYSVAFVANGGTGGNAWSVSSGSLPQNLALSAAGILAGTPTLGGSFSFTVRVADNTGQTAAKAFTLAVSLPATPSLSITGLTDTAAPAAQPLFNLELSSAYALPITGRMTLSFVPDAVNPSDDPGKQFSTGGRVLDFTIAAGNTRAFSTLPGLQTGTVAGNITVTVTSLSAAGVSILPPNALVQAVRVPRSVPVITSVRVVRTGNGFDVQITGYSTPRQVTQATFIFKAAPGGNLETNQLTVESQSIFTTWYTSASSVQFGSSFLYTQPFSVQGSIADIESVTVVLSNSVGVSLPASAAF
jgi:hypothetical protein